MTEPSIRPEVVALLADTNPIGHPDTWNHHDGRPLTAEERDLAGSATRAELQAARDYLARAEDYATDQAAEWDRVGELVAPYAELLPADAVMREVVAAMPEDKRRELMEIMARLAPDGKVVPPVV